MKKHLLTIGLRRCGTTAFWRLFRQDKRFLSFDEPFNSLFWWAAVGNDNNRGTFSEFADHKDFFLQHGSHIDPCQETAPLLLGHQLTYMKKMFELHPNLNVNETRLHNKIDIIKNRFPDVFIVLLLRDPRAWITSQLKPKGHWHKNAGLPDNFFRYTGGFDHWRYQYIASINGYTGFAHEKLYQCWAAYHDAAIMLKPDMIVQFEEFCYRPEYVITEIYEKLNIEKPDLDFSIIHEANKPFSMEKPHEWIKMLAKYGETKYIWTTWGGSEESEDYLNV